MKENDINQLLAKLRTGSLEPAEELLLKKWLHNLNAEGDAGVSDMELLDLRHEMWSHIQAHKSPVSTAVKPVRRLWPRLTAAAVILTVLSIGLYKFMQTTQPIPVEGELSTTTTEVDKAYLTLSDGRVIALSDTSNGEIAAQAGMKILRTAAGEITYVALDKSAAPTGVATYHTITTPRFVQYRVVLPDGTKVLLNSASSIKYPNKVVGKERRVALVGEAYFEVAKDEKHPFVVESAGQEVTVLGTHFNINSYADEPSSTTTLLEGSVKVTETQSKSVAQRKSILLVPNQQSSLIHGKSEFDVKTIEPTLALAWKDGYFHFDNLDIGSIMRTISRWYKVEIVYEGAQPETMFSGRISRNKDVTQVLELLASTGALHYKIEPAKTSTQERRITIQK